MAKTEGVKHVPMRTCIQTREKLPKKELSRFAYLKDEGKILFDPLGKVRGRGANLKKSLEVFDEAVKSGAFKRAFKTNITQENLEDVRKQFKKHLERETLKGEKDNVVLRVKVDDKVKLD